MVPTYVIQILVSVTMAGDGHTHTHTQGQRDEDVESWEKVDFILLLYRLLWRKKRMRYGRCVCVCVCVGI